MGGLRKSGGSSIGGEKLIYIELVGKNTIALKMDNFYNEEIKNIVKALPESKYDGELREWLIRDDLQDRMIREIAEICFDLNIKIVEIP